MEIITGIIIAILMVALGYIAARELGGTVTSAQRTRQTRRSRSSTRNQEEKVVHERQLPDNQQLETLQSVVPEVPDEIEPRSDEPTVAPYTTTTTSQRTLVTVSTALEKSVSDLRRLANRHYARKCSKCICGRKANCAPQTNTTDIEITIDRSEINHSTIETPTTTNPVPSGGIGSPSSPDEFSEVRSLMSGAQTAETEETQMQYMERHAAMSPIKVNIENSSSVEIKDDGKCKHLSNRDQEDEEPRSASLPTPGNSPDGEPTMQVEDVEHDRGSPKKSNKSYSPSRSIRKIAISIRKAVCATSPLLAHDEAVGANKTSTRCEKSSQSEVEEFIPGQHLNGKTVKNVGASDRLSTFPAIDPTLDTSEKYAGTALDTKVCTYNYVDSKPTAENRQDIEVLTLGTLEQLQSIHENESVTDSDTNTITLITPAAYSTNSEPEDKIVSASNINAVTEIDDSHSTQGTSKDGTADAEDFTESKATSEDGEERQDQTDSESLSYKSAETDEPTFFSFFSR